MKAVVIGGGPAGCATARALSELCDVTVIEEHAVSGMPVQCTGLFTPDVLDLAQVDVEPLNALYGANVHFPGGGIMTARSNDPKALLLDRCSLDKELARSAIDAGAEFRYSESYRTHSVSDGVVSVETSGESQRCDLLIGADGFNSSVAASLGNNGPREYVRGIQVDIRHRMDDQGMMELRIGSEVAPGFFSWEIPFGDFTRVGLCTSWDGGLPSDHLKVLLEMSGLRDCEVVAKYSGKIPLGGRRRTYGDNLLLIGDAAGQVKPISGGGLYPMLMSIPAIRDTVAEAISSGDLSSRTLSRYEKRWKKAVGKELKRGYRFRKMYTNLGDADYDRVFSIIDRQDIRAQLDGIELDRPSDMGVALMRNLPVALRLIPTVLKSLF